MARDTELLRVERVADGTVAVLTLDDPGRRNALRFEMTQAIGAAVVSVVDDVGAIVLAAQPPTFCAGGSLDELLEPVAMLEEIYAGMLPLADAPVPTIAAVGGAAIGAGVNLPLFCDVIVTSPAARFDPRWLDVEIHPGGGHLARLAARVGRQGAAALVLCGDVLDGEEAVRAGLAWRCVPDDELLNTAIGLATRAARRSRDLVVRTKQSLDASLVTGDPADALEIEIEAQRWSMSRPAHHRRVADIKASIDAAAQRAEEAREP